MDKKHVSWDDAREGLFVKIGNMLTESFVARLVAITPVYLH